MLLIYLHPQVRGPAQDRGRGRGGVRDVPLAGLHQDRDKQVTQEDSNTSFLLSSQNKHCSDKLKDRRTTRACHAPHFTKLPTLLQMRGLAGQLVVRGDGGALRGAGAGLSGAGHARRVRSQVGRGALARPHLRRLAHQGPPLLQVHTPGRQIRCRGYQVQAMVMIRKEDIENVSLLPLYFRLSNLR